VNASSMNLAVIAILLPTAVDFTSPSITEPTLQKLSVAIAGILIVVYGLTLLFSMKTHTYLYDVGIAEDAIEEAEHPGEHHKPNLYLWISVLLGATLLVAVESELLVGSLEVATKQLGLSELFTGVILLPIIGNAAEHATAVTVAVKNKMDLSLSVAVGSSMQIALFVAPVLVIAGWFMGQPMDLDFNNFELITVTVAILVANSISSDGKSNWLEGFLLLATYAIIGLAFFFHPMIDGIG
jgi:Ca2+:H+ antiporter